MRFSACSRALRISLPLTYVTETVSLLRMQWRKLWVTEIPENGQLKVMVNFDDIGMSDPSQDR